MIAALRARFLLKNVTHHGSTGLVDLQISTSMPSWLLYAVGPVTNR